MITFSHPESVGRCLTECYAYLATKLSQVVGYSIGIKVYAKAEVPEKDSFTTEDGALQVRLAGPKGEKGRTFVTLDAASAADPFCKKVLGAFVATTRYIAKNCKRSWDIKALLIREEQFLWDNLVLSMLYRGNQKYNVLEVLNTLRSSLLFRYEGLPAPMGVLVTWNWYQLKPQLEAMGCAIVAYSPYFDLATGLRTDKALHLLSDGASSLFVVSPSGEVASWVLFPGTRPLLPNPEWELVPEKYWHMHRILRGRDIIISTTSENELFVFSSQFVMKSLQGGWSRVSAPPITDLLLNRLPSGAAEVVVNLIRKLSNDHVGALICITDNPEQLSKNSSPGLCEKFGGKSLFHLEQTNLAALSSLCGVDGATIINQDGEVVNAGVILGITQGTPAPGQGARSAAALFASQFGLAIKVSHDGPIAVYENGKSVRLAA